MHFSFRFLDQSRSKRTEFKPGTANLLPRPRNVGTAWWPTSFGRSTLTTSQPPTNKQWEPAGTWVRQGPCHNITAATSATWTRWRRSFHPEWVTTITIRAAWPDPPLPFLSGLRPLTCPACRPRWWPVQWPKPQITFLSQPKKKLLNFLSFISTCFVCHILFGSTSQKFDWSISLYCVQ